MAESYQVNMETPADGEKATTVVKDDLDNKDESFGACSWMLIGLSYVLVVLFFPIALFVGVKIIPEYERAVIYRLGRIRDGKAAGPGMFFILPCTDTFFRVDMRTMSLDLPRQEILSKDSVTVAVDAVVYYRVFECVTSVNNIVSSHYSTKLLSETTLRNVLGTHSLAEILSQRESLTNQMRLILDEATDRWGIHVERIEIKDVRLPSDMQRAMAAEAEATREAKAKIVAAEGEHTASRALKEAADVMNESPIALQLRYLQTLNTISAEQNHTIVLPIPVDLIKRMVNIQS